MVKPAVHSCPVLIKVRNGVSDQHVSKSVPHAYAVQELVWVAILYSHLLRVYMSSTIYPEYGNQVVPHHLLISSEYVSVVFRSS